MTKRLLSAFLAFLFVFYTCAFSGMAWADVTVSCDRTDIKSRLGRSLGLVCVGGASSFTVPDKLVPEITDLLSKPTETLATSPSATSTPPPVGITSNKQPIGGGINAANLGQVNLTPSQQGLVEFYLAQRQQHKTNPNQESFNEIQNTKNLLRDEGLNPEDIDFNPQKYTNSSSPLKTSAAGDPLNLKNVTPGQGGCGVVALAPSKMGFFASLLSQTANLFGADWFGLSGKDFSASLSCPETSSVNPYPTTDLSVSDLIKNAVSGRIASNEPATIDSVTTNNKILTELKKLSGSGSINTNGYQSLAEKNLTDANKVLAQLQSERTLMIGSDDANAIQKLNDLDLQVTRAKAAVEIAQNLVPISKTPENVTTVDLNPSPVILTTPGVPLVDLTTPIGQKIDSVNQDIVGFDNKIATANTEIIKLREELKISTEEWRKAGTDFDNAVPLAETATLLVRQAATNEKDNIIQAIRDQEALINNLNRAKTALEIDTPSLTVLSAQQQALNEALIQNDLPRAQLLKEAMRSTANGIETVNTNDILKEVETKIETKEQEINLKNIEAGALQAGLALAQCDLDVGCAAKSVATGYAVKTAGDFIGKSAAQAIKDGTVSTLSDLTGISDKTLSAGAGDFAGFGVNAVMTLLQGGSIGDVVKGAVQSAVSSIASQFILNGSTQAIALFGQNLGLGGGLGFGSTLSALGPFPYALAIAAIAMLISQMMCPIVVVELPNGTVTMPSSFLVGKINKQMKGDSWEKIVDSHQSLVTSPGKEAGQKLPLKLNSSTGEIVPDTMPNTGEELGVVIGEVLPEILNLDSLKVFDLQFSAKENGEWFMDQNGHPQYFSAARMSHWKDIKAEFEPMKWGGIVSSQQSLVPSQNSPVSPTKDYRLATSDFPPVFTNTSGSEFTVNVPQTAELKLLFEGGIQTAYHAKKLNMLARFRPVLTWFYALSDETFIGKIVEREIFAKEGFTLEQKVGDEWVKVYQWVTYEDQKRAVIVSSQQSLVSSPNSPASLTKDYRLATSDYITFRVMYDPAYLKLSGVSASIEPNPVYTETELTSSNLFPSLKETDNQLETIETGTYYKFVFHLPKIDESKMQREVFMKTNGYYHPLTDKAYLDEMRANYGKVSGWINAMSK